MTDGSENVMKQAEHRFSDAVSDLRVVFFLFFSPQTRGGKERAGRNECGPGPELRQRRREDGDVTSEYARKRKR